MDGQPGILRIPLASIPVRGLRAFWSTISKFYGLTYLFFHRINRFSISQQIYVFL